MTSPPWWELWPEVLEREIAALDAAGIGWKRDEAAFSLGILRLNLAFPAANGNLEVHVVYPDHYPYFRFQAYAPGLNLSHHQNPFQRNLCLIGRRTHFWNTDDTAAGLLVQQLPKLIATAEANDLEAVADLEEPQAEPFSNYYPYKPSMILVQSEWSIDQNHRHGTLLIGTPQLGDQLPDLLVRGAVLEIRSEAGELLCSATPTLKKAFPGKVLEGRWARVSEPIREFHEGRFIEELARQEPQVQAAKPNHVNDGWLRVLGVLFPEETAHRVIGEGWVFVCAIDKNRPKTVRPPRPHFHQSPQNVKRGKRRK